MVDVHRLGSLPRRSELFLKWFGTRAYDRDIMFLRVTGRFSTDQLLYKKTLTAEGKEI